MNEVITMDVGGPMAYTTTFCLDRYIALAEKLVTRIEKGFDGRAWIKP